MIAAYLDASVLLRIVLEQDEPLAEWNALDVGVSSELARLECYRSLERLWRDHRLSEEQLEAARSRVGMMLRNVELIRITRTILALAAEPFAAWVASLDAIHLATAMIYRRRQPEHERSILFATHDRQLAHAARAMHFDVIGVAT